MGFRNSNFIDLKYVFLLQNMKNIYTHYLLARC